MVALYIVVQTGSRNEVEPGKSGYAHLFEHLMFRGSENYTPEQRDLVLKKSRRRVKCEHELRPHDLLRRILQRGSRART